MNRRQAFTLVEMAIVLVIVGLLVGGVLAALALIRQAEIRAISNERTSFEAALYTFRNKYNGIPGDLPTAFNFFGTACGTNTATIGTGCNGDGNEQIDYRGGENVKAWEHLALAQLIPGTYTGNGTVDVVPVGPSNAYHRNGTSGSIIWSSATNLPKSGMDNSYWNITDESAMAAAGACPNCFPPIGGGYLELGALSTSSPVRTVSSMSVGEVFALDQKIDDGRATRGKMRGYVPGGCGDGGGTYYYYIGDPVYPNRADYMGTTNDGACMIGFILTN
jgi:prepilin-type N-terminal cleavage/methylation domain-containing protein